MLRRGSRLSVSSTPLRRRCGASGRPLTMISPSAARGSDARFPLEALRAEVGRAVSLRIAELYGGASVDPATVAARLAFVTGGASGPAAASGSGAAATGPPAAKRAKITHPAGGTPARAGTLALPCAALLGPLKDSGPGVPLPRSPVELAAALAPVCRADGIDAFEAAGPYLNARVATAQLGAVVASARSGSFLAAAPAPPPDSPATLIEYSQPNTHKAFHVGHLRNAVLGDTIARLHRYVGRRVVTLNYFGDEGAHVAKCLWRLTASQAPADLESLPAEARGEALGAVYVRACEELDLGTLTSMPWPGVVAARVLSVGPHPDGAAAPPKWRVVTISAGDPGGRTHTVVCGGEGYGPGDVVAWVRPGCRLGRKEVGAADFRGVVSEGMLAGRAELGLDTPPGGERQIMVLPPDVPLGAELAEAGRRADAPPSVLDEWHRRVAAMERVRRGLERAAERWAGRRGADGADEADDEERRLLELWLRTRSWSVEEFRRIYAWLGCEFSREYYESEMTGPGKSLVAEWAARGAPFLVREDGESVLADLSAHGLGRAVLVRSDGGSLYITKDLALALRKFHDYPGAERSVMVVDAAQSLHFQQVFKVLELAGHADVAARSAHIPYGLVVLPTGKMSSRDGSAITFSLLRERLLAQIRRDFFSSPQGASDDLGAGAGAGAGAGSNADAAAAAVAVATLRYGMLKVDAPRDIVFDLDGWLSRTGNTGPYLVYAVARARHVLEATAAAPGTDSVDIGEDDKLADYSLLDSEAERAVLSHLAGYWAAVEQAAETQNPSVLCNFLFELARRFSSWYEQPDSSVRRTADPKLRAARRHFVAATADTLETGLGLLGIPCMARM